MCPWQSSVVATSAFLDVLGRSTHLTSSNSARAPSPSMAARAASTASYLLENGTDICAGQDLLGHTDVSTTMIDIHVIKRPGVGAPSPPNFD